ncbi:PP2C family protein-serine/threonine phosphatase [Pseudooceanicola sp. HF7]|uniref:PP2C family protein-serine/threonine phosphatase n=1 Tax=Pseudooceanicola sp. HF7 TaxID=2721560 RepID=UPI001431F437|nr:PP2C family protein-serine/threonine phosphatase [Pseudooceanicola sp. HF7]NIZ07991.1 PP2C family protein-serine/threonine phosphatase [Pseudooceanicola sp. HF7]
MLKTASLRGRIALITAIALLIVTAIMLLYAEGRAKLLRERFAADQLASNAELLTTVIDLDAALLQRIASDLARQPSVDALLATSEEAAIAEIRDLVAVAVDATGAQLAVTVLDQRGTVVARLGTALIGEEMESDRAANGLNMTLEGDVRLVAVEPVRQGTRVTGRIIASLDLLDRTGRFLSGAEAIGISSPGGVLSMNRAAPDRLRVLSENCCTGTATSLSFRDDGARYVAAFIPLRDNSGALLADFVSLRDVTASSQRHFTYGTVAAVMLLLAILLTLGTLMRVLRVSFRPLGAVVKLLQQMESGSTTLTMKPMQTSEEIQALIDTVERVRAGQEARDRLVKLDSQLAAARNVQQSLVPSEFDLTPKLSLFGAMQPAEEVGGDFFDLFEMQDGRIALLIADVSGKGIGPALFAARASMVLRANASKFDDLSRIVSETNDQLCEHNTEDLFITMFFAVIDPETGQGECVNCGHCQPFLIRPDKTAEHFTPPNNIVLGAFEGFPFEPAKIAIAPEDTLLVYSDGFDEAQTDSGELLGDERARQMSAAYGQTAPQELVEGLQRDIAAFSDGAPQADDITLLAVRRRIG